MNINKFKYVIAIAEFRNITKAAQSLYISQPALTKSLNLLEEELGVALFDRNTTPLQLTYAGEIFLDEAQKMLGIHEHLLEEMKNVATMNKSRLILGIPGERGSLWLPKLLPPFMAQYPEVELQVIEGTSRELETAMLNGTIDITLYTLPIYASGITFEIIADDPIVIATAKSDPFCRQFDLSQNNPSCAYLSPPSMLIGQKFLSLRKGGGVRRIAEYLFERHGLVYDISQEFFRHETAVRLSAEGMGMVVTTINTPVRTGLGDQMAYFSLDNPCLCRKVIFAYQKDRGVSLAGRAFIDMSKDLVSRTPSLVPGSVNIIPAVYADRG